MQPIYFYRFLKAIIGGYHSSGQKWKYFTSFPHKSYYVEFAPKKTDFIAVFLPLYLFSSWYHQELIRVLISVRSVSSGFFRPGHLILFRNDLIGIFTVLIIAMLVTKRNLLLIAPGFGVAPSKDENPWIYWSTIVTAFVALIIFVVLEYCEV